MTTKAKTEWRLCAKFPLEGGARRAGGDRPDSSNKTLVILKNQKTEWRLEILLEQKKPFSDN